MKQAFPKSCDAHHHFCRVGIQNSKLKMIFQTHLWEKSSTGLITPVGHRPGYGYVAQQIGASATFKLREHAATSGAMSEWSAFVDGVIWKVLSVSDTVFYMGGSFTEVNGESQPYLVRLTLPPGAPPPPPLAGPVIWAQPSHQSVVVGQTATFSVVATGAGLTYQWQKDGANIVGADAPSYATSVTVLADSGAKFRVIVTGTGGLTATSTEVTLTVTSSAVAPSIVTHPVSVTVNEGQPATFSVTASGTSPMSYQWQKDGIDIIGATSANYVIGAALAVESGRSFRCVVMNAVGDATSNGAVLNVISQGETSSQSEPSVINPRVCRNCVSIEFQTTENVQIYDIRGRMVAELSGGAALDPSSLSSGQYRCKINGRWQQFVVIR